MMHELEVGRLPLTGLHLVEASAGTGKTHSIALLYLRLLLESGYPVARIAVVTFTDAATRELRARLRARIAEALACLRGERLDSSVDLEHILAVHRIDAVSMSRAQDRLNLALIGFDEADVSTLHGLCARLLAEIAFETGQPFAELAGESNDETALELVRDYWRRSMVAVPDIAAAAIIERWPEPDKLANFLTRSQVFVVPAECIDPVDPVALAVDAQLRLDAAVADWTRLFREAVVAEAVEALKDLLETKSISIDKKKSAHHAAAMSALSAALDSYDQGDPDVVALLPLAHSAIMDDRAQKLVVREWRPEGALVEVAECVELMSRAFDDLATARIACFVRGAIDFVRAGIAARNQRLRRLGFDDLIGNLHLQLHGEHGEFVARRIAESLPAILVDEFQDTDPLQYAILRRIHAADRAGALFLIGDPKQAIYRFRGGDIFTYRSAAKDAGANRYTLLGNWRSDARLIQATNTLFEGVDDAFLYPFIPFNAARFPDQRKESKQEHSGSAPLTIWRLPDCISDKGTVKAWTVAEVSARVLAEVCREIKGLLSQSQGSAAQTPSIAVLVNTNRQAEAAARALAQWNVPCEYLSTASVYASAEAIEVETLIAALCAPGHAAAARAALATELLGEDLDTLLAARSDLDLWESQLARISSLRKRWLDAGPYAVIAHCVQAAADRLLPRWNGKRMLTNLLHLAELLQEEASRRPSPDELLRWLVERRDEAKAKRGKGSMEFVRPADDSSSVQILTIHRSKGLEFDTVFAPFLFGSRWQPLSSKTAPVEAASWHDEDQPRIDIGGPDWLEHALLHRDEQFAESLRLAYVAITRARHRVWLAWAFANTGKHGSNSRMGPLSWLWFRDANLIDPADLNGIDLQHIDIKLNELAERSNGTIAIVPIEALAPAIDSMPLARSGESLSLQAFAGHIDRRFETWSYSRLFGGGMHAPVADHDESMAPVVIIPQVVDDPVPQWPRGAEFGDCVHAVFEFIPFAELASPIAPNRLGTICDDYGFSGGDHGIVAAMARATVSAELLPGSGLTLASLGSGESLAELEFLFPLGGESLDDFEHILARHPRYARRPGELRNRRGEIAGLMIGFIDLVVRWNDRYYIVDYKTNLLGGDRSDYVTERLSEAVRMRDYDLQYLIYLVALQRFLRDRLGAEYDFDRHIGGALYLFVRGMRVGGNEGIHHDRPDRELIDALDAWCAGGSS